MTTGRTALCATFILNFAMTTSVPGAHHLDADPEILDELSHYADSTSIALGGCPFAVVVSRHGDILLETYSTGAGRDDAPLGPVGPESLWPLFSISKSYAAALLLNLEHEGALSLDDKVSRHLPEFGTHGEGEYDRRDVTLRQLASHSSGLEFPDEAWDRDVPDLSAVRIVTPPGEVWNYTGWGMHVLERTIEAAAGREYADLLQERILGPLGLKHTHFVYALDPALPILRARPAEQDAAPEAAYALSSPRTHIHSGVHATARDHHRFAAVWLAEGTLDGRTYWSADRQKQVWKRHSTRPSDDGRYGLLWWLFDDENGYVMSGSGSKVTAVAPGTGVAVTILRLPLPPSPGPYNFYQDKRELARFANRLAR